ncbi:flagellar basal body-associated FliL family protein [Paracoccus sp. JM45]|uniref:flagellar basal body-associated FliL family protein n=1 Tax=Paracoccus sp. JM45 TaxID=2283626 RepID=UPI000E6C9D68|nr:flagellar basal body-associated FliL family protein [Paracoccus sp. JM45]RJE80352.1 hypothetical protein DWB67_05580 [Paracoccus sp. JM45]
MIRKLIPILLPLVALLGGAFGGDMLRAPADAASPTPESHSVQHADDDHATAKDDHGVSGDHTSAEGWFTFPTQFFVPLARQGDSNELMIITLTLQTDAASIEAMRKKEHALRDALLRQLLIHANTGGFDGNYTADRNLVALRQDLLKAASTVTDLPLKAVLIEDIARQQG